MTQACESCGEPITARRATKRFCSDRCRKAALRADASNGAKDSAAIRDELRRRGLVGRVWPIYAWDDAPTAYALLVPASHAAVELGIAVADLRAALREHDVYGYEARVEERLIGAFYSARKHRRIGANRAKSVPLRKVRPDLAAPESVPLTPLENAGFSEAQSGGVYPPATDTGSEWLPEARWLQ